MAQGGYVAVAGGVNVDIGGIPFGQLIPGDSNPGKVSVTLGGVGRNIAHNARLLGVEPRLLTAVGEDLYAEHVTESCRRAGIDLSEALRVPGGRTSTYLFLCGREGDMMAAVSDMTLCDEITPGYLSAHAETLNGARVVAADTNIPEDSLRWLGENCEAPLFVDPVSTRKAEKIRGMLRKIHTLKPNRMEAEALTGVKITDRDSLMMAAGKLLGEGIHRVFISLGADGVLAAERETWVIVPACPSKVRNATGAGDAFMGALIRAYYDGMNIEETARYAAAAAALAVESPGTICEEMSHERVMERMAEVPAGTRL